MTHKASSPGHSALKESSVPKSPRHFLVVGDPYLLEQKTTEILANFTKEWGPDFHRASYRLSDVSLERVISEARSLPFMVSAQVLSVKEAEEIGEEDFEFLSRYLEKPSQSSALVLESFDLEKTAPLVKLIEAHGRVIFLEDQGKKAAGSQLIKEKLKRWQKTITPGALARLETQMGESPLFLESVMDQIVAYAGDQKQITEEMVELFEENWKEIDVFKLTDAIAAKNTAQALSLLRRLAQEDEKELIALFGILHWQMRRLWEAKFLLEKGESESEAFRRCKVSPKQGPYFARQLRNFPLRKLEQALEGLFQIDWKMKTGRVEAGSALEAWIAEVTQ